MKTQRSSRRKLIVSGTAAAIGVGATVTQLNAAQAQSFRPESGTGTNTKICVGGNAFIAQKPSQFDSISYQGNGSVFSARNTGQWIHVPVPYVALLNNLSCTLTQITIWCSQSGGTYIQTFDMFDGGTNLGAVNFSGGAPIPYVYNCSFAITQGLGVSLYVVFPGVPYGDKGGNIQFTGIEAQMTC